MADDKYSRRDFLRLAGLGAAARTYFTESISFLFS